MSASGVVTGGFRPVFGGLEIANGLTQPSDIHDAGSGPTEVHPAVIDGYLKSGRAAEPLGLP